MQSSVIQIRSSWIQIRIRTRNTSSLVARPPKEGDGVMIKNEAGAGLAPLGNFCDIAGCQVVLLKMPKRARLAPGGFTNLRVSATQNH